MDAGIIDAMQRHYRCLHRQNDMDRNERGYFNVYKSDQLTALKWNMEAWKEIVWLQLWQTDLATLVFTLSPLPSVVDQEEQGVEERLQEIV